MHAANSAATLREPRSHLTLVRCGIAIYGCDPMNQDPDAHDLEPALELRSYVAAVKRAQPGDSTGYGRRFISPGETWIATVPIGYGDGIRRALTNNCDVLISRAPLPAGRDGQHGQRHRRPRSRAGYPRGRAGDAHRP